MSYREEKQLLENFGCENIKYENYSSNYCIIFNYNNKRIVAEHTLNVYGESVDMWELYPEPTKRFDDLETLLNYIK